MEHWDLFIVHCLHDRLDSELQRVTDERKAEQMLEFIEKQANALKNSSSDRTDNINAKAVGNREYRVVHFNILSKFSEFTTYIKCHRS